MIWPYLTVILAILLMWGWREVVHDRERKDLYNRLMSRDLTDYRANSREESRPPKRARNFVLAGLRQSVNQMNGTAGD